MRCLSPAEVEAIFVDPQFSVSLKHAFYRSELCLDEAHAEKQTRIAAEQPASIAAIPYFVNRLNRWLPNRQPRLLWVDHWETAVFGGENAVIEAAWRGLGEARLLNETPGLYFDAQNWAEEDQSEWPPTQAKAFGLIEGILTILMMTQSDGWLISKGSADRIEFWEGHFFFHSDNEEQLRHAEEIVDEFGCVRWKE